MKQKLIPSLSVIIVLIVLFLSTSTSIFINTAKAEDPSHNKCKWLALICPDGTTHYESCVVIGNGYKCSCGLTTRDCPPSQ